MANQVEEKIYKVKVDTNEATSNLDKLKNDLGNLPGVAGSVVSSLKGVGIAMKAIATNPIGLFITAIMGLFSALRAAMQRNEKAMANFNKIMAYFTGILDGVLNALGPVVEMLTDKLLKAFEDPIGSIKELGKMLMENIINRFKAVLVLDDAMSELLKGNFKEAAKLGADAMIQFGTGVEGGTDKIIEAKNALVEFGKTVKEEADKAIDANKRLANSELELLRIQKEFEYQQLRFQTLAEKQRQIRDDESKSIAERMEANKQLGVVLDNQLQAELKLAKKQQEFAELNRIAKGTSIETETALLEARNKIAEINERIDAQRSEQLTNENALIKEQTELQKKQAEELIKQEADKLKAKLAADKKLKKEQADADKKLSELKDKVTTQSFELIGSLADENSVVGKGAAIAQIGINTYEGASKAFAQGGIFGIISAALITAAGLKAANDAAKIKIPTRSFGKSSGGNTSAPSINFQAPSFQNALNDNISVDRAGQSQSQASREAVRAYVVLDDINGARQTSENINNNATI